METLKIAMLAPEFLPNWGGAGTYSILLARELSKTDEVHVFTTLRSSNGQTGKGTKEIEAYFDGRVKIHLVSRAKENFWYNAIFQFNVARNMPKIISKDKFNIIHSNHAHMPDLGLKLRKLDSNSITTIHTTLSSQYKGIKSSVGTMDNMEGSERMVRLGYYPLRVLERYYFHKSDNIIFVSDFIRRETKRMVKRPFPRSRLIRNGVDLAHFNNLKTEEGKKERANIMYCGRLLALKGLYNLMEAFAEVHKSNSNTHLTLVGGGNIQQWKRTAKERGIPEGALTFKGQMSYEDMPSMIANADIFVLPSMSESMPLSLIEAMACGKACVASKVGGIPEIINHEENGFLVTPGDSRDLSIKINTLVNDPGLRKKFGDSGRAHVVENFALKDMVSETREMFVSVAEGG
ncbi:MAG: glycosyltransferase family 4 protein [Deltaproteobacteria bacterium]|nr:glycosyltransferase family 4 protein [Deltaproteobacteria bacterium]